MKLAFAVWIALALLTMGVGYVALHHLVAFGTVEFFARILGYDWPCRDSSSRVRPAVGSNRRSVEIDGSEAYKSGAQRRNRDTNGGVLQA
jgi:hypothetical protein